jgi:hypothetical protein
MSTNGELNRKLRMALVGGGQGSFIGRVHCTAAVLDNRAVLVAGALSSNPEKATASAPDYDIKTERAYGSVALAQDNVEKLFWFRAGYDPLHRDLFDASRNPTDAYRAMQTLSGQWDEPTSIATWASSASAQGSIATLSSGTRVAIVWNDGDPVPLDSLGLDIASVRDQNGDVLAKTSALGAAPVFLALND